MGRRLAQVVARFQPRHHHFHRDHGVVDQQAERDDQRAERDALQRNVGVMRMTRNVIASTSGNGDRDDEARRAAPG